MGRRRSRKPKITGSSPVCAFFPLGFHQLLSSYAKRYIYPLIKTGSGEKTHSQGLVAQWITRLTTDQKIPGSNPGKVEFFFIFFFFFSRPKKKKKKKKKS